MRKPSFTKKDDKKTKKLQNSPAKQFIQIESTPQTKKINFNLKQIQKKIYLSENIPQRIPNNKILKSESTKLSDIIKKLGEEKYLELRNFIAENFNRLNETNTDFGLLDQIIENFQIVEFLREKNFLKTFDTDNKELITEPTIICDHPNSKFSYKNASICENCLFTQEIAPFSISDFNDTSKNFSKKDILKLLDLIETHKDDWNKIAEEFRTKTKEDLIMRFLSLKTIYDVLCDRNEEVELSKIFETTKNQKITLTRFLAALVSAKVGGEFSKSLYKEETLEIAFENSILCAKSEKETETKKKEQLKIILMDVLYKKLEFKIDIFNKFLNEVNEKKEEIAKNNLFLSEEICKIQDEIESIVKNNIK